uniref:Uncharacterized protein n=1 Tax=Bactrocera dorsalis TaxID=27457 RepID=A0A034WN31_BACDO
MRHLNSTSGDGVSSFGGCGFGLHGSGGLAGGHVAVVVVVVCVGSCGLPQCGQQQQQDAVEALLRLLQESCIRDAAEWPQLLRDLPYVDCGIDDSMPAPVSKSFEHIFGIVLALKRVGDEEAEVDSCVRVWY